MAGHPTKFVKLYIYRKNLLGQFELKSIGRYLLGQL